MADPKGKSAAVVLGASKDVDGNVNRSFSQVTAASDLNDANALRTRSGDFLGKPKLCYELLNEEAVAKGQEKPKVVEVLVRAATAKDGHKIAFDPKTEAVLGRLVGGFLKRSVLVAALLALLIGFAFTPTARAQEGQLGKFRTALEYASVDAPVCLKPASGLVISCYQGNVYLGDGAVLAPATVTTTSSGAETATTLTATASMTGCPATGSCNYIYVDSSGVLHVTTALTTASTASTAVLYYVATSSTAVTMMQPVWRDTNGSLSATSTGSGAPVLGASPTLVTPTLTAPVITNGTTAVGATLSPTCSANSGQTIFIGATTGEVVTLPTPAAGCWFKFIITVSNTSGSNEIETGTSQYLLGNVQHCATGIACLDFWADGSSIRAIKMDGAHLGGLLGSVIKVEGTSSTVWSIEGTNEGTSTMTTAFTTTP